MIPKFRAWNKELKFMFNVDEIDFGFKNVTRQYTTSEDNEIELMQSTGLFVHDIELFEGDILQEFIGYIHVIEWNTEEYMYFRRRCFDGKVEGIDLAVNNDYIGVKIVGNIYENPGLLIL